ncbi:hypothetical protein QCE63_33820 [Caballeronia sp. LZ065]|uniref:hypothetical protein n=1 Tax=Caballeronia sp. LZ065 TaxID=3038571 RepID=UPI002865A824|nr:hypothetical protein [Caballeronia sp. LZ065]MDR5784403.1 hypothetical protein [Caballeronia sp. LZ065]
MTATFIAVFVAGVALRRQEMEATGEQPPNEVLKSIEVGRVRKRPTIPNWLMPTLPKT